MVKTSAPARSNRLPCGSPGGSVIQVDAEQGWLVWRISPSNDPLRITATVARSCVCSASLASGGKRTHETSKPSTSAQLDRLLPSVIGACPAAICSLPELTRWLLACQAAWPVQDRPLVR